MKISKETVTAILKKTEKSNWRINYAYICEKQVLHQEIYIVDADEIEISATEMDEMWSFYHDKKHQIWLWWAIDHETGVPLAYCFGTREHKYLDELRLLLSCFLR